MLAPPSSVAEASENLTVPALRVFRGRVGDEVTWTLLITAAMEFWTRESVENYIDIVIESYPSDSAPYAQVIFPNRGKCAWD